MTAKREALEREEWKHSRKLAESAERKCFCISTAISNWKRALLKAARHAHTRIRKIFCFSTWKLSSRCEFPLLRLNNRKQWNKRWAVPVAQPTNSVEGEGRYLCSKNGLQCTGRLVFFFFSFHRCLVCEVRSRDLYFQFVHKYRSAYT